MCMCRPVHFLLHLPTRASNISSYEPTSLFMVEAKKRPAATGPGGLLVSPQKQSKACKVVSQSKTAQSGSQPITSQTLYIKNLNDQIHPSLLKSNLYILFSTYGDVFEIVIKPHDKKMRGQAHVILNDPLSAELALKSLQDFNFFGKPLHIEFSRNKSKIISRIDGTLEFSDSEDEVPHYE